MIKLNFRFISTLTFLFLRLKRYLISKLRPTTKLLLRLAVAVVAFPIWLFIAPSISAADDLDLAWTHDVPWKNLLHRRQGLYGPERSAIKSAGFFLAPKGADDPEAEAVAFIKALKENRRVGRLQQTVFCAFPERTRFVIEKTKLFVKPEILHQTCDLYDRYFAQFNDPEKISVVFSSAYPNNPASMFGHTFLKIQSSRKSDLLDVGLNYAAAVAEDENPFAFFWFGTTGGYKGRWSVQPYYVKVQDYVNFESRDLWQYDLSLTKTEVKRFLDHIWELETNAQPGYYFFDENCSYQILAALQAVRPDWNLLTYKLAVIPGETLKFLTRQDHSVEKVTERPSLTRQAQQRYDVLSAREKRTYNKALDEKSAVALAPLSLSALDALLIELDLKRNRDRKNFADQWAPFESSVRRERARRGPGPTSSSDEAGRGTTSTRPDTGHDSFLLQTGAGSLALDDKTRRIQENRPFVRVKLKLAYHDLLNSDAGYAPFSQIDFPWISVQFNSKNKLRLEEIGLLETVSLDPVTHFKTPVSYQTKIAVPTYDLVGRSFRAATADFGLGLTTNLDFENQRVFAFVTLDTEAASAFKKGYRILPGFELGYLVDFSNRYKAEMKSRFRCNTVGESGCHVENETQFNQSLFLSRNQEIRNTNSFRKILIDTETQNLEFAIHYLLFFN